MLDDIKKIIPKMEKSDSEVIYNNLINRKENKKNINLFKNKMFYAIASFIVLIAIFIPIGINLNDKGGNTPGPDIWEEGPGVGDITDIEDIVNLGNGVATLEFVDCYHGDSVDVLSVLVSNIGTQDLFIKSTDINNQIVDVQVKGYDDKVVFQNPAFVVDVKDMRYAYIDIHFMEGTLEKNLVSSDDDKSYNDKDHASQKTNVTYLELLISVFDLSGGYEEVRYVANYDYIDDEPQMLICGVASTYIEAMNLVNMPALITFEDNLPSTITYHKTNRETEVFYSYDYKEYSRIAVTAIISDIEYNIKSFADKYIDIDLYVFNKTESIINDSLEADYYICYKNDEDINMAYVITSYEVNDVTCYYMIHFDLYNGEASDSIEEIVNTMSIIYN